MEIDLINKKTNEVKTAPLGFSWTVLLFGCFVPLFRSDFKWAAIMFLATASMATFTMGFGGIIVTIIFGFIYNNLYITDLLNKGFEPRNQKTIDKLIQSGHLQSSND